MSDELGIRVKIHLYRGQMIIAICDSELIGRTLDNKGVPFNVTESFYGGPSIGAEDLARLLKEGGNMNILGERCMAEAVKSGIVNTEQIILVEGVPHVQVYRMRD
jgi:hypothetical protein